MDWRNRLDAVKGNTYGEWRELVVLLAEGLFPDEIAHLLRRAGVPNK